jgi:hypothetical protein
VQSLAKQVMGLSKYRKFDTAPAGRFSLADDGFERLLPAIALYCRFWPIVLKNPVRSHAEDRVDLVFLGLLAATSAF